MILDIENPVYEYLKSLGFELFERADFKKYLLENLLQSQILTNKNSLIVLMMKLLRKNRKPCYRFD